LTRGGIMTLRFHNTLTRRKENFTPLIPGKVRFYACGPTVYDNLHIGNGRMLIVFDVLFRLLRHTYGVDNVTYVRNITDVDDKINARAAERGIDIRTLTDGMIDIFHEDAAALGCLPPTLEPRATDHIAPMIVIMERLIARGHAYAADGHVLFDVPSMPDYGKLANKSMDEQIAGARVEVAPYKRGATDFVLWKPSSPDEPGWDSPWGRGRPGWHLECSAMSWQHLGETFDIHGGGIDLVFPHHENEIAQSRCAFGHDIMAKIWMHNGHLQVEGEKMSKSRGNFITIRDLWSAPVFGGRAWSGDALRLAMLRTHYRQPIDFTVRALEEAERALVDFAKACAGVEAAAPSAAFLTALADDLNTPQAIAELYALRSDDPAALRGGLDLLGFKASTSEVPSLAPEAQELLRRRLDARAAKNWSESDRLRDELAEMGVAIKDNKDGTTSWERKRS
jgi:cysteinyl-tRNA synthetase